MAHRHRRRSRHHVTPRAAGGGNNQSNVVRIDDRLHRCIHEVFDALPPDQYLPVFSREPHKYARRLVRALIRHFGVSVVREALQ